MIIVVDVLKWIFVVVVVLQQNSTTVCVCGLTLFSFFVVVVENLFNSHSYPIWSISSYFSVGFFCCCCCWSNQIKSSIDSKEKISSHRHRHRTKERKWLIIFNLETRKGNEERSRKTQSQFNSNFCCFFLILKSNFQMINIWPFDTKRCLCDFFFFLFNRTRKKKVNLKEKKNFPFNFKLRDHRKWWWWWPIDWQLLIQQSSINQSIDRLMILSDIDRMLLSFECCCSQ